MIFLQFAVSNGTEDYILKKYSDKSLIILKEVHT